jgi:hypothetical protein
MGPGFRGDEEVFDVVEFFRRPRERACEEIIGSANWGAWQFDPASFDWAPSAPAQDEVNLSWQ